MKKIRFFRAGRIRTLKEGITAEDYQKNHPDAIRIKRMPNTETLESWMNDGGCEALDGCWVEPDGVCAHGSPSWLVAMGVI